MTNLVSVEREALQALFDIAVGSMNFGSGFLDKEEVDVLVDIARTLGVADIQAIPETMKTTYPHLWHQDCDLPWRCNKPQGHPIHHLELPA